MGALDLAGNPPERRLPSLQLTAALRKSSDDTTARATKASTRAKGSAWLPKACSGARVEHEGHATLTATPRFTPATSLRRPTSYCYADGHTRATAREGERGAHIAVHGACPDPNRRGGRRPADDGAAQNSPATTPAPDAKARLPREPVARNRTRKGSRRRMREHGEGDGVARRNFRGRARGHGGPSSPAEGERGGGGGNWRGEKP
jgi:hypothetical protein